MKKISDIRNYMSEDQLKRIAANSHKTLEINDDLIDCIRDLTMCVVESLDGRHQDEATAAKARACFEAMCHYAAIADDGDYQTAKSCVLGWVNTSGYNMDFKHLRYTGGKDAQ